MQGWIQVGVTFVTQFLCMGFSIYAFAVFLKPLNEEFGGGRFGVTTLPLAMSLTGIIIAPVVGRLIARGSIRNFMTLGCVSVGAAFLIGARATELWHLALVFGTLISFGMNTMGGVTTSTLVVNWFDQSRARALGISLMGVSLSGMVMAHVATWLVQSGGWRETYEIFGWIVLGIAPLVFLTAVGKPEDKGLRAYGAEEGASNASAPDPTFDFPSGERRAEWTTLEALREPNLWVISIVAGLTFMGTTGIMTHILAFGTDSGLDSTSAAWLLSMLAGGAVAGKLVFGWLADRLGERPALIVSLVMQILAFAVLTVGSGFWPLIAICTFLGLGVGGAMQLAVALLARAFGPAVFGQMMGLMMPLMIPFQSMGAPLAGFIFDKTGSYVLAFWVFSAALTAAAIVLSFLRLPDEQPRPVSELAIEAG